MMGRHLTVSWHRMEGHLCKKQRPSPTGNVVVTLLSAAAVQKESLQGSS